MIFWLFGPFLVISIYSPLFILVQNLIKSIKNAGKSLFLSSFCLRSEYFYFETEFVSNKHDYRLFHLSENIVHQAISHITLSDPIKFSYITQFFVIFLFFIELSLIQDHPQLFSLIHSEAEME